MQRQELSREKLLSKLMMSVQAFTYSCSCEAYEVRRLIRKLTVAANKVAGMADASNFETVYSKFGIESIACDGTLVIMPLPSASEDDGCQPFNGRLGRLRYFGLAVMAAAGAVAADLVQLVLPFPLQSTDGSDKSPPTLEKPYRAPIVYPILYGHVLTHVVAAICASSGRARARSDSLELVWPVPFSNRGSFVVSDSSNGRKNVDSVVEDCEGFVKLGLLARILQVLLGKIDMPGLDNISGLAIGPLVVKTLRNLRRMGNLGSSTLESSWLLSCITILEMALTNQSDFDEAVVPEQSFVEAAVIDRFHEGCALASKAACSFLADIGTLLQVLLPGVMARYASQDVYMADETTQGKDSLQTLEKLRGYFRLEPLSEMLESSVVREVVANWYESARRHASAATLPGEAISGSGAAVSSRLFRTHGFRMFDWPMESCKECSPSQASPAKSKATEGSAEPQDEAIAPMEIDAIQPTGSQELLGENGQGSPSLVTFSAKKSVSLIGGYASELSTKFNGRPRLAVIPTSYTDLYAELGQLLPDSEQTAVCLVCGEVLNAGGKGECTRHSYKCGAGTGMFFLLQECGGLIMHNGKAAYIHSPYVDSHGETPQYRGRPLNLDLDRFDHLHEVWSGHSVRQQVLAERGSSRQIIVPDFY
jgi:Proteolysis_6 C-terminal